MDPSRDHRISVHEDQAFFREAVLFTTGRTGLNATLAEKLKVPGNPPIDLSGAESRTQDPDQRGTETGAPSRRL